MNKPDQHVLVNRQASLSLKKWLNQSPASIIIITNDPYQNRPPVQ